MKVIFTTALMMFVHINIHKAQNIKYARRVVDTLSSSGMHGRGYVLEGAKIAAGYIGVEFQKFGLKTFDGGYFQSFDIETNRFPGQVLLKINKVLMRPGVDYLIEAGSGGGTVHYKTLTLPRVIAEDDRKMQDFLEANRNNVFVINLDSISEERFQYFIKTIRLTENYPMGVIKIQKKKLTWDVAQTALPFPIFEVMDSVLTLPIKEVEFEIENTGVARTESSNVCGFVKGTRYPDSMVVFTAHYDHLGMMGKDTYFPGANDNASGVAMLLNLVQYYSDLRHRPDYTMVFLAFAGEEVGLLGSKYFTENPLFPLKKIRFLVNMDLLGTGEDGLMAVNGVEFPKEYNILDSINNEKHYLVRLQKRPKAANSDQYFFTEAGVKCFFIYTLGGIAAYHDVFDRPETLPLTKFEDIFRLLTEFVGKL